MRKVVVFGGNVASYGYEKSVFETFGDVEFIVSGAESEEGIIEEARDAEVVLFSYTPITARIIDELEKCKMIMRYGIGYDNIDWKYAGTKGIFVCNAPKANVVDVAEHAIALIFATSKRIVGMHRRVQEGKWGCGEYGRFSRLSGKTIGFVGFGNIGRAVCERTRALGMKPLVYDPYIDDATLAAQGATRATLDEVLVNSDFISLHLPSNEKTRHMIGRESFEKMKRTAVLINTSRGAIVDEAALTEALEEGVIAGAGLDVFEDEINPINPRLANAKNAVLTPHVAWNTLEADASLHEEVGDNVARYLRGERPESIVNGL